MHGQPDQLLPQAARLLEHMRTISDQYGRELAENHPEVAEDLCRCVTSLSELIAARGVIEVEPRRPEFLET